MLGILLNVFSIYMLCSALKSCKDNGLKTWHTKASYIGIAVIFTLLLVNIYLLLN